MPSSKKLKIAALALVPLLAGGFVIQQAETRDSARLLDDVLNIVSSRFVDTVATGMLYEKAARGLVRELNDPYSVLLSPKELSNFNASSTGRYGGIGMEIGETQGFVTVQNVFPNTPAERAGVGEGDRIIMIDTVSVRGWTTAQVSDKLKGVPGTRVLVRFARPGVAEPIPVTFTRAIIKIPAVPYAIMLDGKIGYIPLQQFNETATEELKASAARLIKEGAHGVIVDLRGNPGGIFDEALSISNLFLKRGKEISSIRGRNSETQTFTATDNPIAPDIPLVVLSDGRSASASEIVAGALQDHDRALIVGTTSYGKGLVQTVFPLEGGYALKMTTAKWYTPSGRSIQKDRRLLPSGEFVEVMPDSLETDSVRRTRPKYKSGTGRIVYGGGAVTPDLIVRSDTLSSAEQKLLRALAPKAPVVQAALQAFGLEQKGKVRRDFVVTPAWRTDFYARLISQGVAIDRKDYDAGINEIDRLLINNIARISFGDSTAKRRELAEDSQLLKGIEVLRQARTQADLFVIAQKQQVALQKQ